VSEQSEEEIRRRRAREALVFPLRELAANILRIAKQGGRPHDLPRQLEACHNAIREYAEAHGTLPPAQEVQDILDGDRAFEDQRPHLKKYRAENGPRDEEIAMALIRRGALQVTASLLLDQPMQVGMGEKEIEAGIRLREEWKDRRRRIFRQQAAAERKRARNIAKTGKREQTKTDD
jgi:hypothetical protein